MVCLLIFFSFFQWHWGSRCQRGKQCLGSAKNHWRIWFNFPVPNKNGTQQSTNHSSVKSLSYTLTHWKLKMGIMMIPTLVVSLLAEIIIWNKRYIANTHESMIWMTTCMYHEKFSTGNSHDQVHGNYIEPDENLFQLQTTWETRIIELFIWYCQKGFHYMCACLWHHLCVVACLRLRLAYCNMQSFR